MLPPFGRTAGGNRRKLGAVIGSTRTFSYKIGGEVALKELLVLKGVVQLAVGHAATLKPAVKHLLHTMQLPLALLAGDSDVVDEVPMQVSHLQGQELS